MRLFDSHCHLHDRRVVDAEAALSRARAAGVRGFLLAGVDPEGWLDEDRLAEAHRDVWRSFGVHPQVIAALPPPDARAMVDALADRLSSPSSRPVAVGEIGLDAAGERKASLELQSELFRAQLALARERRLPIVLHVLHAHGRALEILRRDGIPARGGVVHSYSGGAELVRDYVSLGLSLSFAGSVTRPAARRTREAARVVPAERLLVETDAPDQTPEPFRGAPNEPAFLVAIVDAVASLRGEPAAAVAALTDANARRLFGLE